ncbi:hypothetical protein KGM_203030 [Danaus plexippus plexippus]|uniref:Uncharacterized protein n=1 Tax=Danaus plexippus plexippus TaxID=278856 RepID=A0A212EKH8_DANPL|nr:hypothetical protein KGM_203030 [Danaus plexippus plexippus]
MQTSSKLQLNKAVHMGYGTDFLPVTASSPSPPEMTLNMPCAPHQSRKSFIVDIGRVWDLQDMARGFIELPANNDRPYNVSVLITGPVIAEPEPELKSRGARDQRYLDNGEQCTVIRENPVDIDTTVIFPAFDFQTRPLHGVTEDLVE